MATNQSELKCFLMSCATPPLSLPLLCFAQDLDQSLCSTLPNRYEHIQKIVEQVFHTSIPSHILHNMLTQIDPSNDLSFVMPLRHYEDVEKQMQMYTKKSENLFHLPSAIYCLPNALEPSTTSCPKWDWCITFCLIRNTMNHVSAVQVFSLGKTEDNPSFVCIICMAPFRRTLWFISNVLPNTVTWKSTRISFQ